MYWDYWLTEGKSRVLRGNRWGMRVFGQSLHARADGSRS
jgi:hypothetical protein